MNALKLLSFHTKRSVFGYPASLTATNTAKLYSLLYRIELKNWLYSFIYFGGVAMISNFIRKVDLLSIWQSSKIARLADTS